MRHASGRLQALVDLFQPFGIKPEFLGHLDKLLRGLGILDGVGQTLGSDRLVAVVIAWVMSAPFRIGANCAKKVRSRRCEQRSCPEHADHAGLAGGGEGPRCGLPSASAREVTRS